MQYFYQKYPVCTFSVRAGIRTHKIILSFLASHSQWVLEFRNVMFQKQNPLAGLGKINTKLHNDTLDLFNYYYKYIFPFIVALWNSQKCKFLDNKAKAAVVLWPLDFSSEIEYGANKDIHDLVLWRFPICWTALNLALADRDYCCQNVFYWHFVSYAVCWPLTKSHSCHISCRPWKRKGKGMFLFLILARETKQNK